MPYDDQYQLYDKTTQKQYKLSFKLFFILNLFKSKPLSIEKVERDFKERGLDLYDFILFYNQTEFGDLLVQCDSDFYIPDYYLNKEKLSPFTEYSPARLDFLITKYCNLACKHCFEGASSKLTGAHYELSEIVKVFNELDRANLHTIKITGGEPFSIANFDEILFAAANCHFECIILTNAMLINDKHIAAIKAGNIQLGISLDGIDSETHDFIRGKGAFDVLYSQLLKLKSAGVKFCITCSVNSKNFKQIPKLVPFVLEHLGADVLFLNRLRPVGRAAKNTGIFISEEQNQTITELHNSLKSQYGDRITLSDDSTEVAGKTDIIHCAAGNSIIAMDEHFDIYPCLYAIDHKEYVMGNLLEQNIDDVWKSSRWDKFRGKIKLKDLEDCAGCQMKDTCAIKNCRLKPVYEGKSFTSSVSYCWKNT